MNYDKNDVVGELYNFSDEASYTYDSYSDIFSNNISDGKLDYILKNYEIDNQYIMDLSRDFGEFPENCSDIKTQILELFNNVKNLLIKQDIGLIKNCIQSMLMGKDNASRFIKDEKNYMDTKTLNIMNAIVNEYSRHINNLNEALNILES